MPGISQSINDSTNNDNNDTTANHQSQLVGGLGSGKLPCDSFNASSVSKNGFWSKQRNDVSFNQLQKFWCDLTLQARHKLLRIDKQTLFEHARKNMYCSRCNGLLLEGFLQIVMYAKSLQQDAAGHYGVKATNTQKDGDLCIDNGYQDNVLDPSMHPWGGLTAARDGRLTLLDCYLCSKSLKGLQNVFDSARAREKERKLLYPDACGGGGRGWISQGLSGYGRGHGTRETCALHTARLSVETLVDFWSALGDETRQTLLRMKEEDFIERLMYRFDSKRFCRDCRRNVIREFKELKELKRMRKETRCTSWFCVADTAFQCEVSRDTVEADWNQTFLDALESYHHFEWAIGTGEGKSDIMMFKDVGLSGKVEASGLDLSGLSACYITLRALKMDGRCNELCVKAHALRGQQCVHCRLVVGDGYLTITRGESIRSFFEHAEEAEEEEDDDSLDKDGNELDGECSRPQKHAKSPELAREFLLDAATVIFKEQVEKAFREGTARQNAHSIFVCLALKLLEERLHVACKEIITLEKQMKLLEEEEKEKREEEERKERRRIKEKEKKLRRKERLREKDNKDNKCAESNLDVSKDTTPCVNDAASLEGSRDSVSEIGEASPASPLSFDIQDDKLLTEDFYLSMDNLSEDCPDGEFGNTRDWNTSYPYDHFAYSRRNLRKEPQQDLNLKWSDGKKGASLSENGVIVSKYESRCQADSVECTRSINGFNKQLKTNTTKSHFRNNGPKLSEKCRCTSNRTGDRYDSHVCSCNHHNEYRPRSESNIRRVVREPKYDVVKPYYRGRYSHVDFARETNGRPKTKGISGNSPNIKQVWEPLDSQKKYVQSSSNSDVKSTTKTETSESDQLPESSDATYSELIEISVQANHDNDLTDITRSSSENCRKTTKEFHAMTESKIYSKEAVAEDGALCSMTKSPHESPDSSMSSSDNCSSCLSEGDSHTSSLNLSNVESPTSDSEESTKISEGRKASNLNENKFSECNTVVEDENTREQDNKSQGSAPTRTNFPSEVAPHCESGRAHVSIGGQPLSMLPQMSNHSMHFPVYQAPTMGYYHHNPISWPAGPTNGLMSFPNPNPYLYANTFGYDLNGNARFLQYGTLQHMAPPLLNPAHLPVFPQVSQANGVSAKEHAKVANLGEVREVQHKTQNVASTDQQGQNGKPDKIDMGNNGFSLFHFGGPVALSDGLKTDSTSFNEGTTGDPSMNLPVNSPAGDHSCNMKDSIEEYNLFASGNGIKFSFF